MKDFMMIFHSEPDQAMPTPEEIQAEVKRWQDWMGGIAAQDRLKYSEGLGYDAKVLHADGSVTDGPFIELKEMVGGFLICTADNVDEVIEMAKGCPVLADGGRVEVRDVMVFDN